MSTTSTQHVDQSEHTAALQRITEWQHDHSYPVVPNHTYPRWEVSLSLPEEIGLLARRAKADRRALTAQSGEIYDRSLRQIQQAWGAGDLTPNQRAQLLAEAARERAARQAHIDDAMAGMDTDAIRERATDNAWRRIAAECHAAIAAYNQRAS